MPVRERAETIHRRGADPLTVTFFETEHGVLDGDPRRPGLRLATRWSAAAGTGARSLGAHLRHLPRARRRGGARRARAHRDRLQLGARRPRRAHRLPDVRAACRCAAPGTSGLVPLPGWDPENDWRGFAAPDDLPRAIDPARGIHRHGQPGSQRPRAPATPEHPDGRQPRGANRRAARRARGLGRRGPRRRPARRALTARRALHGDPAAAASRRDQRRPACAPGTPRTRRSRSRRRSSSAGTARCSPTSSAACSARTSRATSWARPASSPTSTRTSTPSC